VASWRAHLRARGERLLDGGDDRLAGRCSRAREPGRGRTPRGDRHGLRRCVPRARLRRPGGAPLAAGGPRADHRS